MGWQTNRWCPTTVTRFIENRQTSASPIFVDTDAGEGVLKGLGNPSGPHALAAELVGSLLAEWMHIPTFDFSIIRVDPLDDLPLATGGSVHPGPAFISRLTPGFAWGGQPDVLHTLANTQDLTRLVVLDTWIRNCDRFRPLPPPPRKNYDNVYLRQPHRKPELVAMDHSAAFTCGADLTRRLHSIDFVRDTLRYWQFPAFGAFWNELVFADAMHRLEEMNLQTATAIVGSVPSEWQVSQDAREAWADFIVHRAKFLANQSFTDWPQLPASISN